MPHAWLSHICIPYKLLYVRVCVFLLFISLNTHKIAVAIAGKLRLIYVDIRRDKSISEAHISMSRTYTPKGISDIA